MKKVKNIFACLIICIISFTNIIPFSNRASAAEITYDMYVEMARNMVINSFNEKCPDADEYNEYIMIYDVNHETLDCVGTFVFMRSDVNITNIQTFNDSYWGEQLKITTDGLKSVYVNFNVKHHLENDIKLDVNVVDSTFIQESKSRQYHVMTQGIYTKVQNYDYGLGLDDENVVGGIPITADDLFINQFYDESDDSFTFVAIPDKDMYINIRVFYRDLTGALIYEHFEKQSINEVIDGNGPYNWNLVLSSYGYTYPEVFKRHVIAKYVYNFLINEMQINVAYSEVLNYCLNDINQKDQYSSIDFAEYVNNFIDDESRHITGEVSAVDRSYLYLVSGANNVYVDYDESMNMFKYSSDLHILHGNKYVFKIKSENLNCYVGQQYIINVDFKSDLEDPYQQHSMYSFIAGEGNKVGILEYKDPNYDNNLIYDNNGDNVGYIDEDGKLRIDYSDPEFQEYLEQFRAASDEFNAKNITGLFNQFKDNVYVYNEIFDIMPGWSVVLISIIMTALGGLIVYKAVSIFFGK